MEDQTRNLNPTPEAKVAMIIYGRAYSEQRGGSMDFWDKLSPHNKKVCRLVVEALYSDIKELLEGEAVDFPIVTHDFGTALQVGTEKGVPLDKLNEILGGENE